MMTLTTGSSGRAHDGSVNDDQERDGRPRRRSFPAEYKARILAAYDALPVGSTERGALLRREGLYTSHIAEWHRAADAGARQGLEAKPARARKSREQVELEALRRRTARLEAELARTKTALEITGKVHALLEQLSESADFEPPSTK